MSVEAVGEERARLSAAIRLFDSKCSQFLGNHPGGTPAAIPAEPLDFDDVGINGNETLPVGDGTLIERYTLWFPSALPESDETTQSAALELELRQERATRCIHRIQNVIADKSYNRRRPPR